MDIVQAGAFCISIGFILYGILATQQINADSDLLIINMFEANDVFGAACIKLKNQSIRLLRFIKKSQVLYLSFAQIRVSGGGLAQAAGKPFTFKPCSSIIQLYS